MQNANTLITAAPTPSTKQALETLQAEKKQLEKGVKRAVISNVSLIITSILLIITTITILNRNDGLLNSLSDSNDVLNEANRCLTEAQDTYRALVHDFMDVFMSYQLDACNQPPLTEWDTETLRTHLTHNSRTNNITHTLASTVHDFVTHGWTVQAMHATGTYFSGSFNLKFANTRDPNKNFYAMYNTVSGTWSFPDDVESTSAPSF